VKGSNALILLVDDDAQIRATVRSVLQAQGHRTLEAGSGEEALDLIRKDLPDLVLWMSKWKESTASM
jgi:CheY-like chemotaxis protein